MKSAHVPSGFAVILTDRGARDPLVLGKALAAARLGDLEREATWLLTLRGMGS